MMGMLMFFLGLIFIIFMFNKMKLLFLVQNMFFFFSLIFLFYLINISFYNSWKFVSMDYGLDKISSMLILLSIWLLGLMFMSILDMKFNYNLFLVIQNLLLLIMLILYFYSLNLIVFYLFFEMSLLPILMMILGWGGQPERISAGIYMIMYTLFASLPFFVILIMIKFMSLSLSFLNLYLDLFLLKYNFFFFFWLVFMFLVKLPIYLFHLWLPKAHVEAPIFGSMVLAGVLLKLGGYGILRLMFFYFNLLMKYHLIYILFIFIGSLNISILCMRQVDLKMLIAYSSIVHMGFMMVGIFMGFNISMFMGLIMMLGHGLCSSGLFCLLNINYKRINSRILLMNKGMGIYFPNLMMWWFMFCVMNMAAPPSMNLIAEIILFIMILKFNIKMIMILFFLSLFSSIYSIYLFSYTQHGMNYFFKYTFSYILISEYLLMILHWIPLNFFILNLLYF